MLLEYGFAALVIAAQFEGGQETPVDLVGICVFLG